MASEIIERYVELRKELYRIEGEIEAIKGEVAAELRQSGGRAEHEGYEVQLRRYTAWDYTPRIGEMQTELNERKRLERESGAASVREQRDMLVLRGLASFGLARVGEDNEFDEWEVEDFA